MRVFIYRLTTLALAVCVVAVCMSCGAINEDLPTYETTSIVGVGDVAPDFTVTLLDGSSVTLSELIENEVLLVFFSHTCPDCKALFSDIAAARGDFESKGVRVVAISRGGDESEVRKFVDSNGYWFDVAVDEHREIYNLYATMYVPRAYMIDKQGVVVCATVEYSEEYVSELLAAID